MNTKATRRRMISCYAQIINGYVQGYKIPELVKHEKIKARKLSYASQMYLLMLGQFLHVFSLNELVDISKIHARELSRIRGITHAVLLAQGHSPLHPAKSLEAGHRKPVAVIAVVQCAKRHAQCRSSATATSRVSDARRPSQNQSTDGSCKPAGTRTTPRTSAARPPVRKKDG